MGVLQIALAGWLGGYGRPVVRPLGVDIFDGVQSALDGFVYMAAFSLAGVHWTLLRAFIMMGHVIERVNIWLSDQAFVPLIAVNNAALQMAFTLAFVIALLVLGITYMIAVFIRLDVVNFQSALTWYVAGALFFALGPSLYQGMNDLRGRVSEAFYVSTLSGIQADDGGAFALGAVQTADLGLAPLCDYLGTYLQNATLASNSIDGLDVALAYLHADGVDVMGYLSGLGYAPGCPVHLRDPRNGREVSTVPTAWFYDGSYFDFDYSPDGAFWNDDAEARATGLRLAWQSHGRMLTAWPLVLFGIVEQTVYLLLTLAMGITFLIFGVAVLFGFFRRTEAIANAVVNQWIELIVQTVIIGMMQALVVGFFLLGTASGNALVVLAVGLVCLLLMVVILWSGVRAVWHSLNRLFDAFGQGTGQVFVRGGRAAALAAGTAGYGAGKVAGAASATGSALTGIHALQQGATRMQAAGLSFGGSQSLSGAMRAIARTPGLRESAMGSAAEQFLEGASARAIAKSVPQPVQMVSGLNLRGGVALLSRRDSDQATGNRRGQAARPMLLPAVDARLDRWTGNAAPRTGQFQPDSVRRSNAERRQATPANGDATTVQRGAMRVSGAGDVAGTVADALRLLAADRTGAGGSNRQPVDNMTAGRYVARALGVTPVADRPPLSGQDLARLGMFINQATALGLSPRQVEGLIREVKGSPSGGLRDGVRETLVQIVRADGERSWDDARRDVGRLERGAATLPNAVSAYGVVNVSPQVTVNAGRTGDDVFERADKRESALGGSGAVLGQGE